MIFQNKVVHLTYKNVEIQIEKKVTIMLNFDFILKISLFFPKLIFVFSFLI